MTVPGSPSYRALVLMLFLIALAAFLAYDNIVWAT
jgi:hypothetical protein